MKLYLLKTMLLLCALVVGSNVWADEVTDVLNQSFTGVTGNSYTSWSGKTSNSSAVYAGQSAGDNASIQLRSKNSNSGVVTTASGGKVKTITVNWNAGTESGRTLNVYGKNTAYSIPADLYSNNSKGTLLGTIVCGTSTELTVTGDYEFIGLRSASGAMYLNSVTIVWETGGSVTPSISADNVDITYDATSGSIEYTLSNEPSPAGSLTAAITTGNDGNWLTLGTVTSTTVPFTCSANATTSARTATVTLTYTYNTSETVTKEVTITQAAAPVIYSTIPALFTAATSTSTPINVTFGNWVVSGVSGSQAFVTDGSNGFIIYESDHGFVVGNTLSGTASCNLVLYRGSVELTGLMTSTTGLTVGTNGTVTPVSSTIDALSGVNTGSVITLSNLTYDGTNLSDGTNTIKPYNTLFSGTFENGKTYNVTGVYLQYNTTKELLPRSASDIEEVVMPSITVNPTTVEATAAETEGVIQVTYNNFTVAEADVVFYESDGITTTTCDWINASINASNNLEYDINANTGAERTAYMKVYALDDEANELYSTLITVTQAAYEAEPSSTLDFTDTAWGFPSDYITTEEQYTNGGYTITLGASSNGHKAIMSGTKQTALIFGKTDATLSLPEFDFNVSKIKVYGNSSASSNVTFNVYVSDVAVSTAVTSSKVDHEFVIAADKQAAGTIFTIKVTNANNAQISKIEIFGYVSATVTAAEYATICKPVALDFSETGIKAYTAIDNTTSVKLTEIESGQVPANTPVVLYKAGGATVNVPVIASAAEVGDNDLRVSTGEYPTNAFVLSKPSGYPVGFYLWDSTKMLNAGKVYLQGASNAGARQFLLFDDQTTTAVESISVNADDSAAYDLQGRRVMQPTKGLYIVNGKKVVIK